ncbi:MAG TPA: hypothetical protein VLH09_08270 [Bryobacteraceae bacterium]|nr:hypothetical protein [Bryobacteraceae bacterium]
MRLVWALVAVVALQAADVPRIRFTKDFPGSVPAYVAIWVDKNGAGEFKDSPDGEAPPLALKLEPHETEAIFSLAAKLDHFSRPLESGLKVAFTGTKVFRWEDGAVAREVKFTYSTDTEAQVLQDWFERLAETSLHAINLERTARFDRLGLDKALLQLQISVDRQRLAGAQQLLPILDRIAKTQSTFNRVRERAAAIAELIRAGGTKAE